MNLDYKELKICLGIILLFIGIGQGMWVYNMYETYESQLSIGVNRSVEEAVLKEVSERHESLGGTIVSVPFVNNTDTTRYITKTVRAEDTTFQVTIDRQDPNSEKKLFQFLLKDILPLSTERLDQLFKDELKLRKLPVSDSYVELLDLKTNKILGKSMPKRVGNKEFVSSDLLSIDIMNSMGVRGYVFSNVLAILNMMAFQLFLSLGLIAVCCFFLFAIVKSLFWKERMEEMRQDTISAMTHEFKRPISSAVAHASLIPHFIRKLENHKVLEYSDNILIELNKLNLYIDRVQKLSNNSRERIDLTKESIEIEEFFRQLIQHNYSTKEKQVTIELKIRNCYPYLYVDFLHFSNVIDNIIENSIKYSKDHVNISIVVYENQKGINISISDNGFGISDKDIPNIFNKYYRSKNSIVQKKVGFGLGLTYVKTLVEAHQGMVIVNSVLGKGTEFCIIFPIKDESKEGTDY